MTDQAGERSGVDAPGEARSRHGLIATSVAALGVVYGDLGTSPLYTLSTAMGVVGAHPGRDACLGVFSLITWTLLVTVTLKYCVLVMRADNHGEGGILALMSLVGANRIAKGTALLTVFGLLGACLIYGDGVITPAISVLSALEGLNVVTNAFKPYILPIAVAILVALFAVQRYGTATIGKAFGPIMLVWFVVIGGLGLLGVLRHPAILAGLNPWYGLRFLLASGPKAALLLGAVFLCVTGAEALYADMGHFGRLPIRLAWGAFVLPALLLSYAGQSALLLSGAAKGNPFFELAPPWAIYPMVVLATLATIIASQAIITGAFSMTRQAMQLRWLPSMSIRQTSAEVYGQIYVPVVNGLMAVVTILIAVAFRSSDRLAGAYGSAVSTTMLLTTCLLFAAMTRVWRWPLWLAASTAGVFIVVDFAFFGANMAKIVDGGWVPLALGAVVFFVMTTWRAGIDAVREQLISQEQTIEHFTGLLQEKHIPRVPGTAVFFTRGHESIPPLMIQHVRQMGALHETAVALTVEFLEQPRVDPDRRLTVEPVVDGIWRAQAGYGFMEIPDLPEVLKACGQWRDPVDFRSATYFATRDFVANRRHGSRLGALRLYAFAYLYRNSVRLIDRFKLPPANVVEIARQIEI